MDGKSWCCFAEVVMHSVISQPKNWCNVLGSLSGLTGLTNNSKSSRRFHLEFVF